MDQCRMFGEISQAQKRPTLQQHVADAGADVCELVQPEVQSVAPVRRRQVFRRRGPPQHRHLVAGPEARQRVDTVGFAVAAAPCIV